MRGTRWQRERPEDDTNVDSLLTSTAGIVIVIALLAATGAIAALVISGPPPPDIGAESVGTTPPAQARASAPPAESTAGSSGFVENFDTIPMGGEADGWSRSEDAAIDIAALPTAVNRSMRLASETRGSTCRQLHGPLGSLTADFMLDALPAEETTVLTVQLADGTRIGVNIGPDGARVAESAEPVAIEPRAWYRWSVAGGEALQLSLTGPDDALLAEAEVPAAGDATAFCLTTLAPVRAHLDTLAVEAS